MTHVEDYRDVASGSVVLDTNSKRRDAVLVKLVDATWWRCTGNGPGCYRGTYLEQAGFGWKWLDHETPGPFDVLATGLTEDEAIEVAGMTAEQAREWCAERTKT